MKFANHTDRLLSKVVKTEGCWLWTGSVHPLGYGLLAWTEDGKKKYARAHRLAYEVFTGDIPSGYSVCHTCDNRRCVNPAHLFVGTHGENMADMRAKGRRKNIGCGSSNPRARLSDQDVLSIRQTYRAGGVKQHAIAREYGVSQATIARVLAAWNFTEVTQ